MDIVRCIRKSFYLRRKARRFVTKEDKHNRSFGLPYSKLLQCFDGLFNPRLFGKNEKVKGLGEAIIESMNIVKENGGSEMYEQIRVGGATTQIGNIGQKLAESIKKIKPVECKVHIAETSQHASWIGGSI